MFKRSLSANPFFAVFVTHDVIRVDVIVLTSRYFGGPGGGRGGGLAFSVVLLSVFVSVLVGEFEVDAGLVVAFDVGVPVFGPVGRPVTDFGGAVREAGG